MVKSEENNLSSQKPEGVTLRGATRAGKYTIWAAIISIIFTAIYTIYTSEIKKTIESEYREWIAKRIVTKLYAPQNIEFISIKWFDFLSTGENKELIVTFKINSTQLIDVITTRGEKPEIIFHHMSSSVESHFYSDFISANNKTYFIFWYTGGNRSFLDGTIYKYDGGGPATPSFSFPALSSGRLIIRENKDVFYSGARQYYKLRNIDGVFSLESYMEPIKHTSGNHVLMIGRESKDNFILYFDGIKLPIENENNTFHPITLRVGETLTIDDRPNNEDDPYSIRYHISSDLDIESNFFFLIKAKSEGNFSLSLDLSKKLPIKVVSMDTHVPPISIKEPPTGIPMIPVSSMQIPIDYKGQVPPIPPRPKYPSKPY